MNNQTLSEKQHNFARIAIVCLDILKLPLQDTLNIFIKPKDLDTHINSCTSLCTGNTRLNPEQKKKCRNGPNGEPDYKQFDVTLCYKLIRNVCSLPEPQNKWGNKPNPTHQDISDDIERIREFRNRHFAHAECAEISDNEFNDLWKEAESIIKRCQIYTKANGCRQNYEEMLKEIYRTKLTFEEYTSVKERSSAIYIMGEEEVCYEQTAHFEAVVNLEEDYLLQVRWKKIDSHGCKKIDIDSTKYKGSNNRELFVHDLCKKDEARYRAVLSRSQNNKIYSNEVYLRVLGEKPFLEDLKVTSENNEVKIHYQFSVPVKSPNVTDIQWEKNGSSLDLKNSKYLGGSYKENVLIIKCPEEKDSGSYTCRVINAAGSVTKQTVLGIPSTIIEAYKEIVFGSNNTLKGTITSCPSPVKVEWLYSVDGLTFLPIDINSTKHHGSSVDATSPKLLISDADLSHQQYYRISVKNLIGECTSNKMFLQVIGNRPFITSGRSCLIDGSINLSFNINVSEESPPVESVKWTKDGRELKIEKSGGKYSGGNVDDPSLTIDSVNENDAGVYRLKAINPVGDTESDEIILGTPDINFISNDKTDDGGVCIRMKVKSIPVPRCIKWSMKKNNSEPFQQINVNSPEYKGTSHDFPCPVLVVKDKAILEKCSFKIEVQNAVGIGEITITDEMKSGQNHIEKMESGDVGTFYDGHGARFSFARMIAKIADKFPPDKIGMLKTLIHSTFRIVEDKKAASAGEYFCFLQKENILTPTDVIPMQYILIGTECVELERICIEYAKKHRAMYFFEIPAGIIMYHTQGPSPFRH